MSFKLIIALDFDNKQDALALIDQLDPTLCALKIGNEMFTCWGPQFVTSLANRGFKIFLDLKFHDIPNTVGRACKAAADLGVWMLNVHASGGLDMMNAAAAALEPYKEDKPLLIAVTVLTSMKNEELSSIGVNSDLSTHVNKLAQLAYSARLDGVVCSPHEVKMIKQSCSPDFLAITPGIRLPSAHVDDQSRIMTPQRALEQGSDFLVVGRPITRAPDPLHVIQEIIFAVSDRMS